ncbi:hypothetical protein Bbelb_399750 [Branchiostoma belcheri]|nr:hypothetical protein Bbelb_399750 [Branchiostoma belcheri]
MVQRSAGSEQSRLAFGEFGYDIRLRQPINQRAVNPATRRHLWRSFAIPEVAHDVGHEDPCSSSEDFGEDDMPSPDGSEFQLRIFVAGDYAMLSAWYGLSGACGTYPCLWCEQPKAGMKGGQGPGDTAPPKRTLESLANNLQQFQNQGHGDIRKAKHFKNVISSHMLDVPIEQVCIPALHISLGIFHKMFHMLEKDLHDLDMLMATHLSRVQLADPEVDSAELLMHPDLYTLARYVESVEEAREIEEEIEEVAEEMTELEDLLAWALLQGQHDTLNVLSLQLRYQKKEKEKEELTLKAEEIRDRGGVKTSEGPLTRLLDPVLQRYHAKRQAYHSQAFVGNHVNAMLKDAPIKELTSVAANKAEELMMEHDFPIGLFTRAKDLETKYSRLFSLFSTCHQNYSHARPVGEAELSTLDHNIREFMAYFRATFPNASIPPKMHLLEAHVVESMRTWGFGLGFMGEQGIESVHAQFNTIMRAMGGIRGETAQLKAVLKRHLLKSCPTRVGGVPNPTPRKRNDT